MPSIKFTTHDLAVSLQELAGKLLRAAPIEVSSWRSMGRSWNDLLIGLDDKEKAVEIAKTLHPLRKQYNNQDLDMYFNEEGLIGLHFYIPRNKVCEVVEPAREAVWRCEPLLTPEEEKNLGVEPDVQK